MLGESKDDRCILIVDDLAGIRMLLENLFRQEGYTVYTAGNGYEALSLLDRVDVDVVLTDLEMPEMDGWQLAKAVKRRATGVPLVAMTGRGSAGGHGWRGISARPHKALHL